MSFTTLGAVHAFDPGALPGPVAAAVWRGVDMVGAVARTVPTGFGALDAQLPGGGWPTQAVTELLWVRAVAPLERLWATAQLLQAGPVGAVLAWLPQARPEQIRRLQIHAQTCNTPVFLVRPEGALLQASPAPLRVGA